MAEAARVLEFPEYPEYNRGTAAPRPVPVEAPLYTPVPLSDEQLRRRERARAAAAAQSRPAVSLFAVFGSVFAGVLMIFVVLAQVSYNEIASETTRLSAQYANLMEQQRRLEITFESVIDMKEIERYARDELGMSKPDADHIAVFHSMPDDRAEVILNEQEDPLHEFGSFISSLLEYFRKS